MNVAGIQTVLQAGSMERWQPSEIVSKVKHTFGYKEHLYFSRTVLFVCLFSFLDVTDY